MNDFRDPPILMVGSQNSHKLEEIAELLGHLPVRVQGTEILTEAVDVVEDGVSFEENARKKALGFARAAARLLPGAARPGWVLSDDSGLEVHALGGAPGIRSARYATDRARDSAAMRKMDQPRDPTEESGESVDEANNRHLLEALSAVVPANRGAVFVCSVACADVPEAGEPDRDPQILLVARGQCEGTILESPRGAGGFGYDPLFYVPRLRRSYAELSREEKNLESHRGKALRNLAEGFGKILNAWGAGAPRGGR